MKHKVKVRMARKMQTPLERSKTAKTEDGIPTHEGIFTTRAWEDRSSGIRARVSRKQGAAHARAVARKAAATPRVLPMWRQRLNAQVEGIRQRRAARNAAYQAKHATSV